MGCLLKLQAIKLFGFKSFADKTTLNFSPGITVVVGPNGCGKSNVADSFRWVLGTQSARSLRGEKMEDFIFAGTPTRKPLNMAEVTLVLSNEDGVLPIPHTEVAIQRRIHRSGEAEYKLNGHTVRLKDIQNILWDSGLSKDAFIIIEQGKVEQLINWSPLERRTIFEEAAGIVRFKQRKKETLQKLELLDGNLLRIADIHREVEQQVILLEKQSHEAMQYKQLGLQYETWIRQILRLRYQLAHDQQQKSKSDEHELQEKIQNLQKEAIDLEQQLHANKKEKDALENNIRQKHEVKSALHTKIEVLTAQMQSQSQQKQSLDVQIEQHTIAIETIGIEIEQGQNHLDDLFVQHLALQNQSLENQEQLSQATVDFEEQEERVEQLNEQQKEGQKIRFELMAQHQEIHGELKQAQIKLEHILSNIDKSKETHQSLLEKEEYLFEQCELGQVRVENLSQEIDTHKSELLALEQSLQEKELLYRNIGSEQKSLHLKVTQIEANLNALLKLHNNMQGLSKSTQHLLKEGDNPASILYGKVKPLYKLISADPKYEFVLSHILKNYSQTVVVSTVSDLELVWAHLEQSKMQDISIVCLEWMQKNYPSSPILLLLSHAVEFLDQFQVVDSLNNFLSAKSPEKVVAHSGITVDTQGVLFYGKETSNNPFFRESEIKTLEIQLTENKSLWLDAQKKEESLSREIKESEQQKKVLEQAMRRLEMKLVEENFSYQKFLGERSQVKINLGRILEEKAILEKNALEQEEEVDSLQEELQTLQRKSDAVQREYAHIEETIRVELKVLSERKQDKVEAEKFYHEQLVQLQKAAQKIELQQQQIQNKQERCEQLKRELNNFIEKTANFSQNRQDIESDVEDIRAQFEEVSAEYTHFLQYLQEKKGQGATWYGLLQQVLDQLDQHQNKRQQVQLQLAQLESTIQAILQESLQNCEWDEAALIQYEVPETSLSELEKMARLTKKNMEGLGNVNLASIEEYSTQKERFEFLAEQISDLQTGKAELLDIIADLDATSSKMFKETFDAVRGHFRKNFQILFNGGEADLSFIGEEHYLEAGIDIIAKPPGKQMRSIQLLSGGEKCLTAMALLFAIFEVKPAPFCILDEIDAPLDDSNIGRFVDLVRQYIDKTQFIIISHNKITMGIADVLFGVSMEEKGVSKLLGINFEKSKPAEFIY